jgi:hypothetical protein
MDFSMRLTSPASTRPGPTSTACVTPAAPSARTVSSHRTGWSTCRKSRARTPSGSAFGRASTLAMTGKASGRTAAPASGPSSAAAAGAISGQWKGAETFSMIALPLRAWASSAARLTAPAWPAITIWVPLKFAGTTTSPCAASAHTASTSAGPSAITAAIAPSPGATASCIARPRTRTSRTASPSASAPAATSALYSPRLWPAAA